MKRALSSVFMAGSLILAGALPGLAHAADAAQPDAKAGEQLFVNGDLSRGVLACITCHGEGGNSTIPMNPNLAAMPHEYIAKQLRDLTPQGGKPAVRTGADGAPSVMSAIAPTLTPQDIQNVALYLSQQKMDWDKAGTATNESSMDRGQTIWRAGIASRQVPACAACHSANGAGLPAEYPRLAGQHPGYLLDQLKLFRSGDRANDVMHDIADRMNDADLAAVADYAAGLR
ncbi:MAG: c-type cytochrome [Castellaniella sp.]|uniref:c-type cytochrome n=1 Tax=Castellaniella sp. TaxID=1955812 RepID=UPI002A365AC5|nr:c-type cytochrome [Castellaniella sp.]MDY0309040.1 c-type cytochrome [Castellaniella sp.]